MQRSIVRATRISHRIATEIRRQIASGSYLPGSALPSARSLALELAVARSTVALAFEQLAADGYVELAQGRAPRVSDAKPKPHATSGRRPTGSPSAVLSRVGIQLLGMSHDKHSDNPTVDFRPSNLYNSGLSDALWRKAANLALYPSPERLQLDHPAGIQPLRKSLTTYMWRSRGIRCDESQVIVVNGSQQGIDLCGRLLLNPADRVVLEEPGYILARYAFQALSSEIVPIPVDRHGMRTGLLENVDARLAYTTPSHQFPLGGILPVKRRQELLDWSVRQNAFILEDDYDGEFRHETKPGTPLHAMSDGQRVIYLGTMSKTFSPELRLGYLVVPQSLVPSFEALKWVSDRHSADFQQLALHRVLSSGSLDRHIRKVRREIASRRKALLTAVESLLGDQVTLAGAVTGLHVVIWFNRVPADEEQDLLKAFMVAGVALYGIAQLYSVAAGKDLKQRAGAILAYGGVDIDGIRTGVGQISSVLSKFRPKRLPDQKPGK